MQSINDKATGEVFLVNLHVMPIWGLAIGNVFSAESLCECVCTYACMHACVSCACVLVGIL